MEKRFILFILLLVFISGCENLNNYKGSLFPKNELSGYSGRGVTVEFLGDQPPREIDGEFTIGLLFKNYKNYPMSVEYKLWDESSSPVFLQPETGSLLLEAPDVDPKSGKVVKVGYEVISFPSLMYEDFVSGDTAQMNVVMSYDMFTENYIDFCIEIPDIQGLPDSDTEGGCRGDGVSNNQNDPVYIASFKKQVTRVDPEGRDVNIEFDLDIRNEGKGKANRLDEEGKEIIGFSYQNEDNPIDLQCLPDNENKLDDIDDVYRRSLSFVLNDDKAKLKCKARYTLNSRISNFKVKILLDYPYKFKQSVGPITLKG